MEEKLVKEAIAGSKEAFVKLYGEYKDRLYRYALYRLGDPTDAEDAVSECVLAAWRGIGELKSPGAFGSWIFKIMSACCASHIKVVVIARENLDRVYAEGPGSGTRHAESASVSTELAEALAQLKDQEREIVLLSIVGGLSSNEVAKLTGLSAGGVRSKLSRSLSKMRSFLTV